MMTYDWISEDIVNDLKEILCVESVRVPHY